MIPTEQSGVIKFFEYSEWYDEVRQRRNLERGHNDLNFLVNEVSNECRPDITWVANSCH